MDKGYGFLFWAYNIVWIAIAGYITFLVVRLARLRDRIERLERKLAGGGAPKAGGA